MRIAAKPQQQHQQRIFVLLLRSVAVVGTFLTFFIPGDAWTPMTKLSRRAMLSRTVEGMLTVPVIVGTPAPAFAVDPSLLEELKASQVKLKPIPDLLEQEEWDKVRSILKVPPVNKLWNLGDSQNPVLRLARDTGNMDLFELKDDLAYNLQLCDQLTYDNSFVYSQPGNGKVKIKEPQELARRAMVQIQTAIDLATSDSSE